MFKHVLACTSPYNCTDPFERLILAQGSTMRIWAGSCCSKTCVTGGAGTTLAQPLADRSVDCEVCLVFDGIDVDGSWPVIAQKTYNLLTSSQAKPMQQLTHNKYKHKCAQYKRRLKKLQVKYEALQKEQAVHDDLRSELQHLKEKIKQDELLHNSYYDALDAQGLICGICLAEVVQQDSLACCSNKLCESCEKQVTEKHNQCPFCRSVLKPEVIQQQQQAEQAAAGLQPPNDLQGPAAHAWAAIQAFLAARREHAPAAEDSDYGDLDSGAGYTDDYEGSGDVQDAAAPDTTMLMAAAAEAMYAARREPEGTCGLCGCNYRTSALATAEQLPDMLLCRSCWRNIPDLAAQPFPADKVRSSITTQQEPHNNHRSAAADVRVAAAQANAGPTVAAASPAATKAARLDRNGEAHGHKSRSSKPPSGSSRPPSGSSRPATTKITKSAAAAAAAGALDCSSKKKRKFEKGSGSDVGGRNKHAPVLKRKRSSSSATAAEKRVHAGTGSSKKASKNISSRKRHQLVNSSSGLVH